MISIIKYLKTILKHKYYVFIYCCKLNIIWRGIIHDLSKFNPKELFVSAKYFNGKISPISAKKIKNGYSKAWLHHKGCNRHHVEYWLDVTGGELHAIKPDWKDVLEMLADWMSATKVYDNGDYKKSVEYWNNRKDRHFMHPATKDVFKTFYFSLSLFGDFDRALKFFKESKDSYEKDNRDRSWKIL